MSVCEFQGHSPGKKEASRREENRREKEENPVS